MGKKWKTAPDTRGTWKSPLQLFIIIWNVYKTRNHFMRDLEEGTASHHYPILHYFKDMSKSLQSKGQISRQKLQLCRQNQDESVSLIAWFTHLVVSRQYQSSVARDLWNKFVICQRETETRRHQVTCFSMHFQQLYMPSWTGGIWLSSTLDFQIFWQQFLYNPNYRRIMRMDLWCYPALVPCQGRDHKSINAGQCRPSLRRWGYKEFAKGKSRILKYLCQQDWSIACRLKQRKKYRL